MIYSEMEISNNALCSTLNIILEKLNSIREQTKSLYEEARMHLAIINM